MLGFFFSVLVDCTCLFGMCLPPGEKGRTPSDLVTAFSGLGNTKNFFQSGKQLGQSGKYLKNCLKRKSGKTRKEKLCGCNLKERTSLFSHCFSCAVKLEVSGHWWARHDCWWLKWSRNCGKVRKIIPGKKWELWKFILSDKKKDCRKKKKKKKQTKIKQNAHKKWTQDKMVKGHLKWNVFRPSATLCRIGLMESCLRRHCHGGPPPPLAGWPPPRDGWLRRWPLCWLSVLVSVRAAESGAAHIWVALPSSVLLSSSSSCFRCHGQPHHTSPTPQ